MALVTLGLKALSISSQVVGIARSLDWLIQREKNCTTAELFKRSFGHAFKQRAGAIARLARPHVDASLVSIDFALVDRALSALDASDLAALPDDVHEISQSLAPRFRNSIVIPNHQLTDDEYDALVAEILQSAFRHFAIELPSHPTALGDLQLSHILDTAHDRHENLLQQIASTVEEIRQHQIALQQDRPELSPTMIQLESVRAEFRNPFRIVTAENFDHDYKLLAQLFMQPSDYEMIRSHDNLIIAGGRGCGKSMILKSMAAAAAVEIERLRRGVSPATHFTFAQSGLDYFGVYVKLFRGYFSEYTPDSKFTEDAAHVYFQHYFNCILLRSLLELIRDAQRQGLLKLDSYIERKIADEVSTVTGWNTGEATLADLVKRLRREETLVGTYVTQLRLTGPAPSYAGTYTTIDTLLRDCCAVITEAIPDLNGCRIYFLLDEYENLAEFQQKVVNTLAKLRPVSLSLKIATRPGGLKCNENLQGEAMQFPRDYQIVSLDYDVNSADYRKLLLEIGRRRLQAEGFAVHDLTKLLLPAPKYHPATEGEIEAALSAASDQLTETSSTKGSKEKRHQWSDALVFRVNKTRHMPWTYAGFDSFVTLSSGIISNFMELCKMATYMADWEQIDVRGGVGIPWKLQNEAVYKASQAYFDWIPRNIAETGPAISRLVSDLADIMRAKLLSHTSEPEAARIALRDPELLESPANQQLTRVLDDAITWSVLQTPGLAKAYLPKHAGDPRPVNYYPNRLLIPHLRLSSSFRWTTEFHVRDLARLLDDQTRAAQRTAIIRRVSGQPRLL